MEAKTTALPLAAFLLVLVIGAIWMTSGEESDHGAETDALVTRIAALEQQVTTLQAEVETLRSTPAPRARRDDRRRGDRRRGGMHRGNLWWLYRIALALMDLHPWSRAVTLAISRFVARMVGFSKRLSDDELVLAARLASRYDPPRVGEQLAALDKPLRVIWATADPAIEAAVSEAILAAAPQGTPLRIEARTHNLQSTHATELADAILEFAGPTAADAP